MDSDHLRATVGWSSEANIDSPRLILVDVIDVMRSAKWMTVIIGKDRRKAEKVSSQAHSSDAELSWRECSHIWTRFSEVEHHVTASAYNPHNWQGYDYCFLNRDAARYLDIRHHPGRAWRIINAFPDGTWHMPGPFSKSLTFDLTKARSDALEKKLRDQFRRSFAKVSSDEIQRSASFPIRCCGFRKSSARRFRSVHGHSWCNRYDV